MYVLNQTLPQEIILCEFWNQCYIFWSIDVLVRRTRKPYNHIPTEYVLWIWNICIEENPGTDPKLSFTDPATQTTLS